MFLSREIDIKLCSNYTKTFICKIYVFITWPWLPPIAVQYTGHVIITETRDNNTALPLEGVLVTWYGSISYICSFWYNLDTVLCQFLETGTLERCLIGIVQLLRLSGFSRYPLSFFLYSPFKEESILVIQIWTATILGSSNSYISVPGIVNVASDLILQWICFYTYLDPLSFVENSPIKSPNSMFFFL